MNIFPSTGLHRWVAWPGFPSTGLRRWDGLVGPVRFELTSLRLKGECRYPLCDEPKMVSAAGFEPASPCLRGRHNQPLKRFSNPRRPEQLWTSCFFLKKKPPPTPQTRQHKLKNRFVQRAHGVRAGSRTRRLALIRRGLHTTSSYTYLVPAAELESATTGL